MRIIYLNDGEFPSTRDGGANVILRRLVQELVKTNKEIFVIGTTYQKSNPSFLNHGIINWQDWQGIKYINLPVRYKHFIWRSYLGLYHPKSLDYLKKIFATLKPDILHYHTIAHYISWAALKLGKKFTNKIFFTAHDVLAFSPVKLNKFIYSSIAAFGANKLNKKVVRQNFIDYRKQFYDYRVKQLDLLKSLGKAYVPWRNLYIRDCLKATKKIFAVSCALKEALRQNKITNNVEVLYNALAPEEFQIADPKIRQQFKEKYKLGGKKIIFFSGRLSGNKGGQVILPALVRIKEKIENVVLLVVGAGQDDFYLKKMRQDLERLALKKFVVFTNWLTGEELKASYLVSDVVVVPSLCLDTFNLVNIEAMAAGKPVVGTIFGGTPEIVIDKVTGFLVNPLNIDELADKIMDLLLNEEEARKFGLAGQLRVKEKFQIKDYVNKLLTYYEQ